MHANRMSHNLHTRIDYHITVYIANVSTPSEGQHWHRIQHRQGPDWMCTWFFPDRTAKAAPVPVEPRALGSFLPLVEDCGPIFLGSIVLISPFRCINQLIHSRKWCIDSSLFLCTPASVSCCGFSLGVVSANFFGRLQEPSQCTVLLGLSSPGKVAGAGSWYSGMLKSCLKFGNHRK